MAGLADLSADDILSSDDTGPNAVVSMAGPGSIPVSESDAPQAQAQEASDEQARIPSFEVLDSAAIEKVMSRQAEAPKAEEPEEVKVDEEKTDEKPKKRNSAQERIVQLIAQKNQALEASQAATAQVLELQRQMSEQQAKFQQEQLELERQRIAMMQEARAREEESRLSDVEKAKRAFLKEAQEQAAGKLSPELKALKDEVANLRAEREAAKAAAEEAQRAEYFRQQAHSVLGGMLLKGYTPEEQQALGPSMEEMLYTFSGAFGVDPVRAAPVFKQFLDKYVKAENSRLARSSGTKVAESRRAPMPVPSARATGGAPQVNGGRSITLADLHRGTPDGRTFDNFIQYNAAGRPALRPA